MRLLLDQGLPRSAAGLLRDADIDAHHTGECGLATAGDADILGYALQHDCVVVTLDAHFHALLALHGAVAPSVIRIRIEGLRAEATTSLIQSILDRCNAELASGAMISVTEDRIRIHYLPV
jgi:predicted nuclease of predicted toxin-antitoxin system